MNRVISSLKENFPDIYQFLLKNQKQKDLIFLVPNGKLYARDSLTDKFFYYHHIFQKSKFDPTLYTNFYGKVLKLIKEKTFKSYLGWSIDLTINLIESNYNDDGLQFFLTDGICLEEFSNAQKVNTDEKSLPLQKCKDSSEYVKYYSQFDNPKYYLFQKGMKSMNSFILSIKNNYLLIKGHEEYFYHFFREKLSKFISAFEIIFKDNIAISREFVDSYLFSNLYDIIMKKLDDFYSNEQKELKNKLNESMYKYSIQELYLDSSLNRCKFDKVFNELNKLKTLKTIYEKTNSLIETNSKILEEARNEYENENKKKFEVQGDLLSSLWTHVLAQYIFKNSETKIYLDYLFLKNFRINGYEENDYIVINFISSIELFQKELLNKENDIESKPSTIPVRINSFI